MSDGNFNRALLPHTPYASGMKAGKQMAKMYAVKLFRETLNRIAPELSDEERKQELERYERELARLTTT